MSTPPQGGTPSTRPGDKPRPRDRSRDIVALIVGGLLVAFALLNLDKVEVNWIVGSGKTPLIVVIIVSMALGVLIGLLVARRRGRRR